ncbi:c2H2-type zinc-finger domain-containing protein [Ditylenchus destructor]|nr:c2H2-type zinc-finger domain-containing protein [Ditylenchus destructor]
MTKCPHCSYATTYKSTLQRHIRTHTGEKPYKCDQCTYASAESGALNKHILTHKGEKPYKCDECSYASIRKDRLESHIQSHKKKHNCNRCSFVSVGNEAMKAHMQTHIGEKPYKCDQCTYASAHSSTLKKHITTHTEKPYKCDKCSYACIRKAQLQSHIRTHEKKYNCNRCSFVSVGQDALKAHMLTHIGEKPHKRNQCASTKMAQRLIPAENAQAITSDYLLPSTSSATGHNEIKYELEDFSMGPSSMNLVLNQIALNSIIAEKARNAHSSSEESSEEVEASGEEPKNRAKRNKVQLGLSRNGNTEFADTPHDQGSGEAASDAVDTVAESIQTSSKQKRDSRNAGEVVIQDDVEGSGESQLQA